jgi:hypothetical protein
MYFFKFNHYEETNLLHIQHKIWLNNSYYSFKKNV